MNDDASINLSDVVFLLSYLFVSGGTPPSCEAAAEVNDDTNINLPDATSLLTWLFPNGTVPVGIDGSCIAVASRPCVTFDSCP